MKPWNQLDPAIAQDLEKPIGMLGPEERIFLYWLGQNYFRGDGAIIDAGAFAGASAYCLAKGLLSNEQTSAGKIHSYDRFVADDQYVVDAIRESFRPIAHHESFRDVFELQVSSVRDLIEVHEGDFCSKQRPDAKIEVLFVDVAKNVALNSHLLCEFFPALIPGRSIVVQQDYYHFWHPHIHVTMELLKEYFSLVDPLVEWTTRVYRLEREIPASLLDEIARYEFSAEELTDCLRRAAMGSQSPIKEMLEAITVYQWYLSGHTQQAKQELMMLEAKHPAFRSSHELWARELTRFEREHLAT